MTDRADALVVTADDTRHVFEPLDCGCYAHTEKRRTKDGTWRAVGSERVTTLPVEDRRADA